MIQSLFKKEQNQDPERQSNLPKHRELVEAQGWDLKCSFSYALLPPKSDN